MLRERLGRNHPRPISAGKETEQYGPDHLELPIHTMLWVRNWDLMPMGGNTRRNRADLSLEPQQGIIERPGLTIRTLSSMSAYN